MPHPPPLGTRLICINDRISAAAYEWFDQLPVKDQIYTLSATFIGTQYGTKEQTLSYQLKEFPCLSTRRLGFSHWRFRPLQPIDQTQTEDAELTISH